MEEVAVLARQQQLHWAQSFDWQLSTWSSRSRGCSRMKQSPPSHTRTLYVQGDGDECAPPRVWAWMLRMKSPFRLRWHLTDLDMSELLERTHGESQPYSSSSRPPPPSPWPHGWTRVAASPSSFTWATLYSLLSTGWVKNDVCKL